MQVFNANVGFLNTPISKAQYKKCILTGVDPYTVCCDVYAGMTFDEAITYQQEA